MNRRADISAGANQCGMPKHDRTDCNGISWDQGCQRAPCHKQDSFHRYSQSTIHAHNVDRYGYERLVHRSEKTGSAGRNGVSFRPSQSNCNHTGNNRLFFRSRFFVWLVVYPIACGIMGVYIQSYKNDRTIKRTICNRIGTYSTTCSIFRAGVVIASNHNRGHQ